MAEPMTKSSIIAALPTANRRRTQALIPTVITPTGTDAWKIGPLGLPGKTHVYSMNKQQFPGTSMSCFCSALRCRAGLTRGQSEVVCALCTGFHHDGVTLELNDFMEGNDGKL